MTSNSNTLSDIQIRNFLSTVAEATASERIIVNNISSAPLLPKSTEDLLKFWQAGLSAVALKGDEVVGHGAIEPLADENWFEFGAVWVRKDMRGSRNNGNHPHVGLRLYRAILARHTKKNILATTINPAAMVVGWRAGMVPIGYDQLPKHVWEATCCCPSSKTGVARKENVPHCRLRESTCFMRVTRETWERMGRPATRPLPVPHPQRPVLIPPDDDLLIVLSG